MMSYFPLEALKSQAVAARTFAIKSTKPICVTQSCQVYNEAKANNPPKEWKKAVDDTQSLVLKENVSSQYSAVTGGYVNGVGFDTKGGSWPNESYEKLAGSPWFYKSWYTKGFYKSTGTCGKDHPWLNKEEMADILNAYQVYTKGKSKDTKGILPITIKDCGFGGYDGKPYSFKKMCETADKFGGCYKSISNANVTFSKKGLTSNITFNTNLGNVTLDGQIFSKVFNLRAPGYISIKGAPDTKYLYDIEVK